MEGGREWRYPEAPSPQKLSFNGVIGHLPAMNTQVAETTVRKWSCVLGDGGGSSTFALRLLDEPFCLFAAAP